MSEPDMERQEPTPAEIPVTPPPWLGPFLTKWMAEQNGVGPEVREETIKLEAALNLEEVTMTDSFRKSVVAQFKAESLINAAQESEIITMRAEVNRSDPILAECSQFPGFPWEKIAEKEVKIISKQNSLMSVLDFSTKPLKHWCQHFLEIFDRSFITSNLGRVAIVFNCCATSTKQRLLSLGVGTEAANPEYTYVDMLRTICVLYVSPSHVVLATKQIYQGVRQNSGDSIPVYLEKIRVLSEDAFGPASRWNMNEVLLIINTVVAGLGNSTLSTMVSSYVGKVPFIFNMFRDTIIQYSQRIPTNQPISLNAIDVKCWRCDGPHYIRECKIKSCYKCGANHNKDECKIPRAQLICSKCPGKHLTKAHFGPVRTPYPRNEAEPATGVFSVSNNGTSFVDGEVSIGRTGTNQFIKCKLLIDTGALVPSGIAISEDFFCNFLKGERRLLRPSHLMSANGATANATMMTLGEVDIKLVFSKINITFTGRAVVLKNLSLPIILGINFLKNNSLSPLLTPNSATLVHTPSNQSQTLIANVFNKNTENKNPPPSFSSQ